MQRLQLARRRGAELVAEQHPEVVVDAQRLGDVARARERLHQEAVAGLAERRAGDELAARALGVAALGGPEAERGAGGPLERLELELLRLEPARLRPLVVDAGQEAGAQEAERRARMRAGGGPLLRAGGGAGGGERLLGRVQVGPDRLGEPQAQALAPLQRVGAERAAQAGEDGSQRGLRLARGAMRPEHLDQLAALGGPLGARGEVRQQGPRLAARRVAALAVELEGELAAEPDPGARRGLGPQQLPGVDGPGGPRERPGVAERVAVGLCPPRGVRDEDLAGLRGGLEPRGDAPRVRLAARGDADAARPAGASARAPARRRRSRTSAARPRR